MTSADASRSPLDAAIAAIPGKPDPAAAAVLGIACTTGEIIIWTRGDEPRLRHLGASVARSTIPDEHGSATSAMWVWTDLTGNGPRWHLALSGAAGEDSRALHFPALAFSDDASLYEDCPTRPIEPPPAPTTTGTKDR